MSVKNCTFAEIIKAVEANKVINVKEDWLDLKIEGLKPGESYLLPLFFYADKRRTLEVHIYKAGGKVEDKTYKFKVSNQKDIKGQGNWLPKRYRITKSRHNGEARIKVGADNGGAFMLTATPLEHYTSKRMQHLEKGECPKCGQEGQWIQMAMVCKEHGVYMG